MHVNNCESNTIIVTNTILIRSISPALLVKDYCIVSNHGCKIVFGMGAYKSMSIGEPLFGVHQHFLLFFRGPMNSYELGYAVFCISEPDEGIHRNKIIILIFF